MLLKDYTSTGLVFRLYSYKSLVLEVVTDPDGLYEVTIDARPKYLKNYTGRKSPTTSKHVTQALEFLGLQH